MEHDEIEPLALKQIIGALRSTIDAHGPITANNIGSAAKRIAGALMIVASAKFVRKCGNCWFCGCVLVAIGQSENRKTVDHLTPRCRGGTSSPDNTVKACIGCNNEKGRLTLNEYRAVISYRNGGLSVTFWGEDFTNTVVRSGATLSEKLSEALKD